MVRVVSVYGLLDDCSGEYAADGIAYDYVQPLERRREKEIKRANQLSVSRPSPSIAGKSAAGKKPKSQPVEFIAPPAERVDIGEATEEIDFQW